MCGRINRTWTETNANFNNLFLLNYGLQGLNSLLNNGSFILKTHDMGCGQLPQQCIPMHAGRQNTRQMMGIASADGVFLPFHARVTVKCAVLTYHPCTKAAIALTMR